MIHTTLAAQNFSTVNLDILHDQINSSQQAAHFYEKIAAYFDQDDVALKGLYKFFRHCSEEEKELWTKVNKYVLKRGGEVNFKEVNIKSVNFNSVKQVVEVALDLDKQINQSFLKLQNSAQDHHDAHLDRFIKQHILVEYVESIKKRSDMITQLHRVSSQGLGIYLFNQRLLNKHED